ncbi:aminotransferase class I/II-fold pyridoxal phosphate-dependent enzyme [Nonomuraea sediminis]|uniref:aminotransferase class I/II-fold pyridoxal phosphate-dependent enzyme n=1 Tax=Nonomuraea sediminis TaxID=2835864 RepID=UPI001BDC1FE6|nr:aminotransferase class I/II-fold pyridoxal phosphate-dependent enzyme [Nonomuraea sediminis]
MSPSTRPLPQGGDLRDLPPGRDYLDLSTCANRYGPPPAVAAALRDLDPRALLPHPYEAEARFVAAYAAYLGLPEGELVAGRGISEFIRLLAAVVPADEAVVITPDYTDTVASFRRHLAPAGTETARTRLDRVAEAMRRFRYVVLSNPNNPLGLHLPRGELAAICAANPGSTLVVDEAYIDFTAAGLEASMSRAGVGNVAVLLSPNKLFGIAGTRTGALWTADARLRELLRTQRPNWPISYLDSLVACAAVGSAGWAATTRARLLATASRMEALLAPWHENVVTGVPVHYRFVATREPERLRGLLAGAGIAVRAFSTTDPHRMPGLRITAPREAEFAALAQAIGELP